MRAPQFWYSPPGVLAQCLAPLGAMYATATARRLATGARIRPGLPVICVGNLSVGGTGKTPTVIALVERLQAQGLAPTVLSRGYGGRQSGPHRVDAGTDSAADVGDEPLLLSTFAPVWVSRDRAAGARAAAASGGDVIVLDDGFQNGDLTHDLSIVVVDAERGFGNGHVLPAGPLREPVPTGLARADLILSIGAPKAQSDFAATLPEATPELITAQLAPLETGMDWGALRGLAFAGIARPDRFFASLRALGVDLVETHALDDHQPLEPALMRRLLGRARATGARLVTTEKDAVRLPKSLRTEVLTLPVRLSFDQTAALDTALARALG